MTTPQTVNGKKLEEIQRSLDIMIAPGQVVEMRALGVNGHSKRTDSGYFNDMQALAKAIRLLDGKAALYITPNPVHPDLLARSSNRVKEWAKDTTNDLQIVSRRWFLIDADPERFAGISSTNEEHEAAIDRIYKIVNCLSGRGWPKPVIADSSNGAHANYGIDLPNTPEAALLIQRCLLALSAQFTDDKVKIDTGNFNAARIWKAYGSTSIKGDDTEERPHRQSFIIDAPSQIEIVSPQQLEALAALVPDPAAQRDTSKSNGSGAFNLESWMEKNNITGAKKAWQTGYRWRLDKCYFSDNHTDGAFIVQFSNGKIGAGCSHNSCQDKTWQDLRAIFDGPKEERYKKKKTTGKADELAADAQHPIPPIITPTGIGTPLQSGLPPEVLAEPIGLDQLLEAIEAIHQALDLTPEQRRSKIVRELAEPIGSVDKAERIEVAGALLTANAGFTKTKADEFVKDCASDVKKAHKDKIKQDNDALIDNLDAGERYSVVDGCIGEWRTKRDKDGNIIDYFAPLCNFNAWIVADVAADDGEEVNRKIAIAGVLENGKPLPEIEIPADEFEAMKWPVALWGARVSIEPVKGAASQLRHAIQLLSDNKMADRRTSTHTGWTVINGKRAFLHAGGALGSDGANVDLPRNLANYRFPDDNAIDPVEAIRESIKLLDIAPARVSTPLWAAMYLGPLSEFIPPVFTISVEGGSGSLKSSYSAVMLNHFGKKFTEYAMPADWLATANSLEKLSFHSKDVPLIIDDLRPSTNSIEARALQDAVSRITRAAGNRQGRSRLDSNSEFKRSYAPRGVVIMTAERKALGKSTNSRILTIDVEPGDIDPVKLSVAQKQRHIYAYAMVGFIQSVAKDWDELSVDLPAQVADLRAANAGNGHHLRLPNATAILHTAFCAAMSYALEIGAIAQDEAERREQECYKALQDMAESQNQFTEAEDPARKYITIIASLIAQDKAYLQGKGAPNIGVSIAEKLGWHDGTNVFLLPGAYNTVCKYATAEGWNFPSDETTLRKELERGGFITKKDGDNRLTSLQRDPAAPATRTRVTAISYSKLHEILTALGYFDTDKPPAVTTEGDNDENA